MGQVTPRKYLKINKKLKKLERKTEESFLAKKKFFSMIFGFKKF